MKTKKYKILYLLICCGIIFSCKKEKVLSPSGIDEMGPVLPKDNTSYNKRILDYYNRWGTYILYNFSDQDFGWQVTGYNADYKAKGADPNYVDKQLDLLDQTFFKYYQDSTLSRCLPVKFFLCSSLTFFGTRTDAYLLTSNEIGGYQSFAVNWGNSRILNINNPIDSTRIFRGNVNYSFLKMMGLQKKMSASSVFSAVSDYTSIWGAPDLFYSRGFLSSGLSYGSTPNNSADWYGYIKTIVSNPYSYLNDANTTSTDPSDKGILSIVKDSKGLIRKKYDAIVSYYKRQYNIDLQSIGNGG